MTTKFIFVYGTLMKGMENAHLIEPYTAGINPGFVYGKVYHLVCGYPALVHGGTNKVFGEIIKLKDIEKALRVLDALEEFYGPGSQDNSYNRIICPAYAGDGQSVDAYVYEWAHAEQLASVGTYLPAGDWRAFYR